MSNKDFGFINPYAFLPVDFSEAPGRLPVTIGNCTGVLECEIITRTPLSIPDTENVDPKAEHKKYKFMRDVQGRPMIPASSIRGPIRSMYEALTGSCFAGSKEEDVITYRTKDAFKPGLLHYDVDRKSWKLFEAKRYIFAVDEPKSKDDPDYKHFPDYKVKHIGKENLRNYCYGQKVSFTSDKTEFVTHIRRNGVTIEIKTNSFYVQNIGEGGQTGYICIGEPFPSKKHFESIFEKQNKIVAVDADKLEEAVKKLEDILRIYRDETVNLQLKEKEDYVPYKGRSYKEPFSGTEYLPIWYKMDGGRIYLSVASIGRTAYKNTMGDMLGAYSPCTERDCTCPACRLFGMIGNTSLGSRVRFTDATLRSLGGLVPDVTLKELAGPKPSYTPFYLSRKNASGNISWSYDSQDLQLAGRKIYWHNPAVNTEKGLYSTKDETGRNATMELVDKETCFAFSVLYDRLTDKELEQLIWLLCLGENELQGKYCYKMGHGKPLGLGSVKIVIKKSWKRIFSENEYRLEKSDMEGVKNLSVPAGINWSKECKIITDYSLQHNYPVAYPAVVTSTGLRIEDGKNASASHQWFSQNYRLGGQPRRTLPPIGMQDSHGLANVILSGTDERGKAIYRWPDGFPEPPAAQAMPSRGGSYPILPDGVMRVSLIREPEINPKGKTGQNYMGFFSKNGQEIRVLNIPRKDVGREILVREEEREGKPSLFFYVKP